MQQHRTLAVELFTALLVMMFIALIVGMTVQPVSKRLAAIVTDYVAAHPTCGGTQTHHASGLICLLYRVASPHR